MVERGQGGAIVNMSSVAAMRALHDHTIYCSAKGALDMLTRTMALELGPHKVSTQYFLVKSNKMRFVFNSSLRPQFGIIEDR